MHTGKTSGIPPRTGLLPSNFAALLTHTFSLPLLFQLMTVAPYSSTSTESPVGSDAITLPFSLCTEGCGPVVEGLMAEGLLGRSMIVVSLGGLVMRTIAVEVRGLLLEGLARVMRLNELFPQGMVGCFTLVPETSFGARDDVRVSQNRTSIDSQSIHRKPRTFCIEVFCARKSTSQCIPDINTTRIQEREIQSSVKVLHSYSAASVSHTATKLNINIPSSHRVL